MSLSCHAAAVITVLTTFGLMSGAAPGQNAATPRSPAEPYAWRSVTIKANGFINGTVFGHAPGTPAYIHTDMGGAYRLDAATNTWVCLTDWVQIDDWSVNCMGVETLATDPTDANRVYAGLGTYMGPSAVIRSDDQGRTWQRTNVPFAMNGNGSARQAGERMVVDPNAPNILFYGTRTKGLWKSLDRGATWAAMESFPSAGDSERPLKDTGIVCVLFDPGSGSPGSPTPVAYAGVMTTNGPTLFRTTDAGGSWSPVAGQPGDGLLPNRAVLAPDGKTLFVTYIKTTSYPGPHSVSGGAVYRVDGPATDAPAFTDISPATGGFGWSGVSIDPTDPATVYVTTLNRYGNPPDDIYRTTDRGATWKPLHIDKHRDDSSAPYAADQGTHWTGDVQVDPHDRNVAYYTTGYGMYRTTNLTEAEPTWAFYNDGFEQSAVLELVSPTSGPVYLLSAIGDRDGYRHDDFNVSPAGRCLGEINGIAMGTSQDLDVAVNDPNVVVRVGNKGEKAQFSVDGGVNWAYFGKAPEGASDGGRIALAVDGKRVIWAPRGAPLSFATRDGATWGEWKTASGAPSGDADVVADPLDSSKFYALAEADCYASADGGATWQRAGASPKKSLWKRTRAISGRSGHLCYAGEDGGFYRSTDGGATWAKLGEGDVDKAIQVGVGAPAPGGAGYPSLFLAGKVRGQSGFYRSDDEGRTWIRINDDAHHYGAITVIQGDARVHGRLYVGSNGRGILYGEPAKAQ